jgi:hypothetical protein
MNNKRKMKKKILQGAIFHAAFIYILLCTSKGFVVCGCFFPPLWYWKLKPRTLSHAIPLPLKKFFFSPEV